MDTTFTYGTTRVRDLGIKPNENGTPGKANACVLEIDGQPVQPTRRFWRSFFMRFGISETVFKYFDHVEVFQRIAQQSKNDSLQFCLQHREKGNPKLLAVTNPGKVPMRYQNLMELMEEYHGDDLHIGEGVITSTHRPRSADRPVMIGGDEFQHRFVLDTPIDGFGQPKIHLSFLRLVCSNGAIGYSRAFRSEVSVGKNPAFNIMRALDTFDNGDGYSALRQRFESAQSSWASLHECNQLYRNLERLHRDQQVQRPKGEKSILRQFHEVTGGLNQLYGLANLNTLSVKRQRVLPAKCRVYDLINFASEVATHQASHAGNRRLQGFIGAMISDEYDMEGTATALTDFDDFFMDAPESAPSPSLN